MGFAQVVRGLAQVVIGRDCTKGGAASSNSSGFPESSQRCSGTGHLKPGGAGVQGYLAHKKTPIPLGPP